MDASIEKLGKEIDIIGMIQSRRYVHLALKHLLEPETIKELKIKSEKKQFAINVD